MAGKIPPGAVIILTVLGMDCGYLGVRTGVAHDKVALAARKIFSIIRSIRDKGVSAVELKRAKSHMSGQLAIRFETSDEIASYLAYYELFHKKIVTPDEVMTRLEKVSNNDILKVADDVFRLGKMNIAIIGESGGGKALESGVAAIAEKFL